jgi:hypothetical protein
VTWLPHSWCDSSAASGEQRLGATICSAFPALRARPAGKDTVLSGVFADQAALYGVLVQLEALGLELIGVRRLPPA